MGKHNNGGWGGDIEARMYPNMIESPVHRWGFIRKVYSIVAIQILITAAVAATVTFYHPVRDFFLSGSVASWVVFGCIMVGSIVVMLATFCLRDRHPINFFLLMLFTICLSVVVGLGCITKSGKIILEAASLTAIVVVVLTLYTFWAAKRGHDFSFLGPFLSVALLILLIYSLVQVFFPLGKIGQTIYGCVGALIFSGFIIYDTDNLIKRYTYDEYISAAISLYLDIINLFLSLLSLFQGTE